MSMVGVDTPSPDLAPFPIHKLLLCQRNFIIENLTNLTSLLSTPSFDIIALPIKFAADGAPARIIAKII